MNTMTMPSVFIVATMVPKLGIFVTASHLKHVLKNHKVIASAPKDHSAHKHARCIALALCYSTGDENGWCRSH